MKKAIYMALGLLMAVMSMRVVPVLATESHYNAFSINGIIPDNQINKKVSYFDLRMTPGQEQDLQVEINNSGEATMEAKVVINAARTGNNGVKIYTDKGELDSSMTYPIESLTEIITPTLKIPPHSKGTAIIKLRMPNVDIKGTILGGIVVTGSTEGSAQTSDKKTYDIDNKVAYALGLKLSMNDEPIAPNLNLQKAGATLTDYHPTIAAQLQNDQPMIMNGVKIQGEVYKKGSSKELSKVSIENGEISPNTNFNVIFDWKDKKVASGTYKLHLKATYQGKVWEWNENFKVKSQDAKEINEKSMFVKEDPPWIWIVFGIIIAVLIMVILILLVLLIKRRKEDRNKKTLDE